MKKIIFTTLLYFIVTNTFSQIIKPIVNEKTKLYDYINTANNNKINKYSYDQASTFSDGMAKVNRNGLWGFINENGDEIIPCKYLSASDFKEGLAAVSIGDLTITENFSFPKNQKYGVINKEGKVVIPFEFKEIGLFINGLARASTLEILNLWGWIDIKGNWIITPKFSDTDDFNENGMAKVRILNYQSETAYGYIDYKGNYIIQPNYSYLGSIKEGLILANYNKDGKYGFLDIKGRIAIPFNYDEAGDFFEEFAIVGKKMINDEYAYGYINKVGNEIIPIQFEVAENFQNGKALVRQNSKFYWINKSGAPINANEYDVVENYNLQYKKSDSKENKQSKFAIVSNNGFWGAINQKGDEIIPVIYDSIGKSENGFVVLKNNTIKYLNEKNELDEKLKTNFYEIENGVLEKKEEEIFINVHNRKGDLESNFENLNNFLHYKEGELLKSGSKIFNDSFFVDRKGQYWTLLNKNQQFGGIYDSLKYYSADVNPFVFAFKNNGVDLILNLSYINEGYKIINTNYLNIELYNLNYSDISLKVNKNGLWGLSKVDLKNNKLVELLPPIYENLGISHTDNEHLLTLIPIKMKDKWGSINLNTKIVNIPIVYDRIGNFNNTTVGVKIKNKWAFINSSNELISPFKYDDIMYWSDMSESNNLCAVKINNKWGFINDNGKLMIPLIFDQVERFDDEYHNVVKINKMYISCGFYDKKYTFLY